MAADAASVESTAVAVNRAEQFLREHEVDTVRVEWCDLHGLSRGKQLSRAHFLEAVQSGTTFSSAALQMDLHGDTHVFPGQPNPPAWTNLVAIPDIETLQPYFGAPRSARCLADLFRLDGSPVFATPRQVLRRVLERGHSAGFRAQIGLEIEFYLLPQEAAARLRSGQPLHDLLPAGRQVYRLQGSEDEYRFLEPLRRQMELCGISVEALCAEDGPGQFEIILSQASPLVMADAVYTVRTLAKEHAARLGLLATFLSRPLAMFSGSGCHIHQSLQTTDGSSAFRSGTPESEAVFWRYLNGQIAFFEPAAAFYLPTINAYKRVLLRDPRPFLIDWAFDDRAAALRVLGYGSNAMRIENRAVAGEANPYLSVAASLAAGFEGIERFKDRPEERRASSASEEAPRAAPRSLTEALGHLDSSAAMRLWLGDELVDAYVTLKRSEVRRYETAITDWELREYLQPL